MSVIHTRGSGRCCVLSEEKRHATGASRDFYTRHYPRDTSVRKTYQYLKWTRSFPFSSKVDNLMIFGVAQAFLTCVTLEFSFRKSIAFLPRSPRFVFSGAARQGGTLVPSPVYTCLYVCCTCTRPYPLSPVAYSDVERKI